MRKNIIVSLMVAFLFATTFSAGFSYMLSQYINLQSVVKQLCDDEIGIAENFIALSDKLDENVYTLADRFSSSLYIVSILNKEQQAYISDENMAQINNGEIITQSQFMDFDTSCLFKVNDDIVSIQIDPKSSIASSFGNRIGLTLSMMLLLSTVLMFFMSKSVTKPIMQLNAATKKVAQGDFDVRVDVEADNEVAQLARSFNSMVNELKSNELLKSDFISNVSHEFKTPLATVNGFAKLLKEGNCTPEEVSEYADIIEHETGRLSTLCSNILRLSRIENQKIITKPSEFSLDEQMRDVLLILEPQWTQKELELNVELEETSFYADEELLQQVWINIIDNAIKFTEPKGKIDVTLKNFDENVVVTVKDNGIGMTDEAQKHIFEKFYQGDRSHASDGNGLGLALVKKIVDICSGTITVSSALGQGSQFTVTLPKNNDSIE